MERNRHTIAATGSVLALLSAGAAASGCAQDTSATAASAPLKIAVELRGHPLHSSAWRPRVRARRGTVVRYRIALFNPGSATFTRVRLRVELPRGLELLQAQRDLPRGAFATSGTPLAPFDPGAARNLYFSARYSRRAASPSTIKVTVTTDRGGRTAVIRTREG